MRINIFFLLVFIYTSFFAQKETYNNKIKDSILDLIDLTDDIQSAKKIDSLLLKALKLSNQIKNDSLVFKVVKKLGNRGLRTNNSVVLNKSLTAFLDLYKKNEDYKSYGYYNWLKGCYYSINANLDSSYYCLKKAKNIFKKYKYYDEVGNVYQEILVIQLDAKDRIGVDKTAIEIQIFLKEHPNYNLLCRVFLWKGVSTGEFDLKKAIKHYNKVIYFKDSIKENHLKDKNEINARLYMSYTYLKHKKYEEASKEIQKGIQVYKKSKFKNKIRGEYYALIYNDGFCKLETGKKELGFAKIR